MSHTEVKAFAGLSVRLRNILLYAGYRSREEVTAAPVSDLRKLDGMGTGYLYELMLWLGRETFTPVAVAVVHWECVCGHQHKTESAAALCQTNGIAHAREVSAREAALQERGTT